MTPRYNRPLHFHAAEDPARPVLEIHLARYELRRGTRIVRLERQPMELLILLAGRRGELVSREAIVERLWPSGVFVDTERGINNAMRKIRTALQDDAERPRYIETVVGKGYRFVGPVRVVGAEPLKAEPLNKDAADPEPHQTADRAAHRPHLQTVSVVTLLGLLVVAWSLVRPRRDVGSCGRAGPCHRRPAAREPLGDPTQDYFAEGMSDELTTQLARVPGLRVTSRTSSKHYASHHEPLRFDSRP